MEQLKYLTGGGAIKARFIAKDWFEFTPTFQIVIATNHRPHFNASDYAAWRRLKLVPFPHTYSNRPGDRPVDLKLRGRLQRNAQREAMLAWLVAGAIDWYEAGTVGTCAPIDAATAEWRKSEDAIQAWWDAAVIVAATDQTTAASVYTSYTTWCHIEGRKEWSNKEFAQRFADHDLYTEHRIEKVHTRDGWIYRGVTLKPLPDSFGP